MTINELQKAIEEYLKLDNTSENDNVCFLVRDNKCITHYPINDYGFGKDHFQLHYLAIDCTNLNIY